MDCDYPGIYLSLAVLNLISGTNSEWNGVDPKLMMILQYILVPHCGSNDWDTLDNNIKAILKTNPDMKISMYLWLFFIPAILVKGIPMLKPPAPVNAKK